MFRKLNTNVDLPLGKGASEYIRPQAFLREIPVDGAICNISTVNGGTTDNFVVDDDPTNDLF